MSIIQAVKNAVAPSRTESIRKLVFAVAAGKPFDEAEAGSTLRGVPVERFKSMVETRRNRLQAAADLKSNPAEEKHLAELQAEHDEARAAVAAAERAYHESLERAGLVHNQLHQLRQEINSRKTRAQNLLVNTADKAIFDEMRAAQNPAAYLQGELRKLDDVSARLAAASSETERLTKRLATLKRSSDPDVAAERAFVLAELAAARGLVQDLQTRNTERARIEKQLGKIQAEVDRIALTRLDPDRMHVDAD